MITAVRRRLAAFFDYLHESAKRDLLDTCVVSLAAVGFLGHLLLVAVVNMLPEIPQTIFEGLDRSLLHAVYTPFSIILFYEVILLVFAPRRFSHRRSREAVPDRLTDRRPPGLQRYRQFRKF